LYQNGKLVDRKTKENIQLVNGKVSYSWTSELQAEKSQFKLKALNNDQTESIPAILNVIYEGVLSGQQTLHVITVGINKYDRPDLQLRFAQKDAFSFGEDLKEHGGGLFKEVLVHDLYDQNAGKNAILQELDAISQQAQSQDVFVFFFSGHGTTMENRDSEKSFFLVPYDVMQLKGDYGHLQEKAISDAELLEAFLKIKAKKQWIILDACYSGALVGAMAFKGAAKDEALYHLARTSGTHIFASSGEQQESVEDEQFGHGIFTYYLLQGLAGQANGTSIDEHITVKELMNFTQSSVLKLRRQQRPTAYSSFDDFPIRLLKR
jgi:uncharacterized caspase-like protein